MIEKRLHLRDFGFRSIKIVTGKIIDEKKVKKKEAKNEGKND